MLYVFHQALFKYPHISGVHQAKRAHKAKDNSTMEERQAYSLAKEKEKEQAHDNTHYQ